MPNLSFSPLMQPADAPLAFPPSFSSPQPQARSSPMEMDDPPEPAFDDAFFSVDDSDVEMLDSDCFDSTDSEFEEKELLATQILQTAQSLRQQTERTNDLLRTIVRLSQQ